jgi:hypothetical protein
VRDGDESRAESVSRAVVEPVTEPKSLTVTVANPDADTDTKPDCDTDADTKPDSDADPNAEPDGDADANPGTHAGRHLSHERHHVASPR